MTLKNKVQPNPIPLSKYELVVLGLPALEFTSVNGGEIELETIDMPDRTSETTGESKPVDIVVQLPYHHESQVAALENWFEEGKDPVTPTYKKTGTMNYKGNNGGVRQAQSWIGVQCKRLKYPDMEMNNDADMAYLEATLRVDDIIPI